MKIRPKKWDTFQHYKDRDPPWIKLHRGLLNDVAFQRLPRASQALAPMLWLLAAEHDEGTIDADPSDLAFRLRWPEQEMSDALSPLIGKGFFDVVQFDSAPLAERKRSAMPEREAEAERETEKKPLLSGKPDGGRGSKSQRLTDAIHVLEFLNGRAGKHFRPVPATLKFIEARLAEGVTVQDLKTLTVRKCREWLGTDQEKFLRPETLFNATKCQSYLGEIPPEEPCNAPPVIAASKPPPAPVPAAGNPPRATNQPPDTMRTVGDVLGSLKVSSAATPEASPEGPEVKARGSAGITFSQEMGSSAPASSSSLAGGGMEIPYPLGSAPLH